MLKADRLGALNVLAIDIDGTLLDSHGRLPDAHRDAVLEVAARGSRIVLVTGRTFYFAKPIAALLPIPLTLILNNGAVVKNEHGATELRHTLPRDVARHILDRTRHFEDSVALVFDWDDGRAGAPLVFERMDWSQPNRRGYFEKNKPFITPTDGPLADVLTEDPIQVVFNGGVEPMRALAAELRAMPLAGRMSVSVTEYDHRDFSLVDVNGAGCSKGATLAGWISLHGWSRSDVMAVGDNLNDVDMLDFAGTPVLMGNAAASLKARGYPVTSTNDEGGLATAIHAELHRFTG